MPESSEREGSDPALRRKGTCDPFRREKRISGIPFETNEEGYLQTPEQLKSGTYRIEEVESPNLFVQPGYENALMDGETSIPLNEVTNAAGTYEEAPRDSITIKVDSETAHEVEEDTGKYIIVVEGYNDEAVGSLTIEKTG